MDALKVARCRKSLVPVSPITLRPSKQRAPGTSRFPTKLTVDLQRFKTAPPAKDMGCLFTKDKPLQYSHAPRKIHVQKVATSGPVFTNGLEAKPKCKTVTQDGIDRRLHEREDPPDTSQSRALSPRPLETLPPTPEDERPSLHVQYAEDLEAVTPLPDVITVATVRPKENRVDVSTVSLNSSEPSRKKHNTMLSNNDVTIEDLDSELDHYSKFRLVYDRPLRPLSESHLQRNKTFVIKDGVTQVKRPTSEYMPLTRPSA